MYEITKAQQRSLDRIKTYWLPDTQDGEYYEFQVVVKDYGVLSVRVVTNENHLFSVCGNLLIDRGGKITVVNLTHGISGPEHNAIMLDYAEQLLCPSDS